MIRDDGTMEAYVKPSLKDLDVEAEIEPVDKTIHELDKPGSKKLLAKLLEWYEQEWERQAHNRFQMAMDEDYYDSLQWTEDDAAELIERGQSPTVYNEIKATIDWLIGTERRTRIDYKVLPRKKEGDKDAEVKTKLLKYLSDTNKTPFARSKGFSSAMKGGMGWLEIGVRGDSTDEPVYHRAQSWRHMLYDSNGVEPDLSDSRYVFRWKYVDVDIGEAIFPDRKEIIKQSAIDGDKSSIGGTAEDDELWYLGARVTEPGQDFSASSAGKYHPYDGSAFAWSRRERVKLVECWYKNPVNKKKMRGGDFDGEYFDSANTEHAEAIKDSSVSIYDRVEMEIRCAIYCDAGLLFDGPSPYKHRRFPFVPIWAYRRARDNAPYSPVRPMRDPQDSLNKRGSKALWILSTNQIEMEEGAVDDIEELRQEAARPDSILVKKKGYALERKRDVQLANEHLMLMDRDQAYIRNAGGVTSENLGRSKKDASGKAIIALQDQGGVVTTELFDNLRYAVQLAGEIELSLVEQYFTAEKTIRIVGERGIASYVEINKYDPENDEILNDITELQADFVVSQQDYRDSLRVAMFESMFDIVGRLAQFDPKIALNLLDLVVEMADIPNRDELVARIRQLNGMRDPEAEPTPEELQAAKAEQELQTVQQELALNTAQEELNKLIAERGKLDAEAVKKSLEAITSALEAAQIVAASPGTAVVADDILKSAGSIDQTPDVENELTQRAAAEIEQASQPTLEPEPALPIEGQSQGIEPPQTMV